MKNQSENNLLYFEDDEIVTGKTENKKVFVTKRINGKEMHTKQNSIKETEYKRVPNTQGFNFEREIVIGVNSKNHMPNNKSFNKPIVETKKRNQTTNNAHSYKKNRNYNNIYNENKNMEDNFYKRVHTKVKKNAKNNKVNKKQKARNNVKFHKEYSSEKNKIKSRKKENKILITTVTLILMVVSIVIMALVTPLFNIQEIKVEGNNRITATNIINLSGIKIGQNIFKNNKKNIENSIKENAYIESVEVKRTLPATINLKVTERQIEYQIKLISSYIYVDKQGNILENSEAKENTIILEGYATTEEQLINGKKLCDQDIQKLAKVKKIKEALQDYISQTEISINIENENNLIIYMKSENKKIYIGDATNLADKMLRVNKIIEKEKGHSGIIFINGDLNEGFDPYFREEAIENK